MWCIETSSGIAARISNSTILHSANLCFYLHICEIGIIRYISSLIHSQEFFWKLDAVQHIKKIGKGKEIAMKVVLMFQP